MRVVDGLTKIKEEQVGCVGVTYAPGSAFPRFLSSLYLWLYLQLINSYGLYSLLFSLLKMAATVQMWFQRLKLFFPRLLQ